jgi:secretion/DNA translocation related TadE-like protein
LRLSSRVSEESGAATVLAAFLVAALVALCMVAVLVGAVVIARHRAQSAADLSALAGARHVASGPQVACRVANSIGSAMGATVAGCEVDHLDVVVTCAVGVIGAGLIGGSGAQARAVARAGPVAGRG